MANKRHSRHVSIVHVLRSREWVSANSLAQRFEVAVRTIYRDIEELIAAGVPIESVSGPEGGYRLASDQPLTPLTLDADEALKLYVVSLLDRRQDGDDVPELGNIYWYWKDEGSGHLPAVRHALLTGTALKLTTRVRGKTEPAVTIVKPYGIVWKAGEWHLVAAPVDEQPTRYRLNLVDHLALTDLRFSYPDGDFHLQSWWASTMEAYGRVRLVLSCAPGQPRGRSCYASPSSRIRKSSTPKTVA